MDLSPEEGPDMRWITLLIFMLVAMPTPASAQETHILVVVGLGGNEEYREVFHGWAVNLVAATVEGLGLHRDQVVYLGERPDDHPQEIQGRSTSENITSVLTEMAETTGPEDQILIVFIGHGSGSGEDVKFNLPGPDLTPAGLGVVLDGFPTQTVALVNTTSSSGPFLSALSAPNRVILTATRNAQERNETQFGGFFVEALAQEGSDLDHDGRISLLEAFQYAQAEVERYYGDLNLLATEHAQLDDNGDGEGVAEVDTEGGDGWLARTFWVSTVAGVTGVAAVPDSITDPILRGLYRERAELERQIQELRALRGSMEESRYEEELERLLVELALKTREIRARGGGG
jgi:hypothetical protein